MLAAEKLLTPSLVYNERQAQRSLYLQTEHLGAGIAKTQIYDLTSPSFKLNPYFKA